MGIRGCVPRYVVPLSATSGRSCALPDGGHARTEGAMNLYNTRRAALALKISVRYVRLLARLHGVGQKFGRDWMFTVSDLDTLRGRNQRGKEKRPETSHTHR